MSQPPAPASRGAGGETPGSADSPTLVPTRRLGSAYVLDERVGSGAQGEVWRAHREDDPTGTHLAVKLLRAELVDAPGVLDRFLRERATLLRIRSPHVVGVRDMVVEGESFAIVMDFVGGGDLRALLNDAGTLAPAAVARLGADLARGLAAVHDAGIVHRDLKPANVLLAPRPDGEPLDPRLADFGVARLYDTVAGSHATGAIGTPLYMAPEILDPAAPTPAADIYSLGIVLYEAACGVPPYLGAPAQVLAQHARRDPGRPEGMPDALWEILLAALAKDASSRPSAVELASRLASTAPALDALPAAAPLTTPPPPHRRRRPPHEWSEVPVATLASGAGTTPLSGAPPASTAAGTATSPAPGSRGADPAEPAAPARTQRGRRRGLVAVLVVLVLVALASVGYAGLRWRTGRDASDERTIASLPGVATASELRRVPDASETVLSPDGTSVAVSSGGTWSLYDLDRTNQAAVWSGTCSTAVYWNAQQLLCRDSDGGVSLIAKDSTTTPSASVPGPSSHNLVGSDGEHAILIDDANAGALVALDASGAEVWRADGAYVRALVTPGFVLAWDEDAEQIRVLSAADGSLLYHAGLDRAPSLTDTTLPGGVGTDVGEHAFYTVSGTTTTVYDATGAVAGTVRNGPERHSWRVSEQVTPDQLLDLLRAASTSDSVTVQGEGGPVEVALDTSDCSASGPG